MDKFERVVRRKEAKEEVKKMKKEEKAKKVSMCNFCYGAKSGYYITDMRI